MLPLDGLVVVDFSRILAGPSCTQLLADHGARVIKVEHPDGDESRRYGPPFVGDTAVYFLACNRGKESIAIDFKDPRGKALALDLIDRADIVVENFRPGVAERAGIGWEAVRTRNPKAIYASIAAFGHTGLGEWVAKGGYDVVMQGMGGIPSLTGAPDGPPMKVGASIADVVAGLHCALGIMMALVRRAKTGEGSRVDISMLESQASLLTYLAGQVLNGSMEPRRLGNRHPSVAPYACYRVADGWMNVAAPNQSIWERLAEALGHPQWITDPRLLTNADRVAEVEVLDGLVGAVLEKRGLADWMAVLDAAGVPCGPILTVPEVLAHPQLAARGFLLEQQHPTLGCVRGLASAVFLDGIDRVASRPPPALSGDSHTVLRDLLELDEAAIKALFAAGVVVSPTDRG